MGMTVNLLNSRLNGRDARLDEAFQDASQNAMALITLAGLSTVVALLTSALRGRRRGGLGDLAASAIQRGWLVVTYLLVPIIILENKSLKDSITRGKALHSGNFVPIAVGEIGVIIVNRIILSIIAVLIIIPGFFFYFTAQQALLILTIVGGAFLFVAAICFTEFVRTSYYTCLYLWAAEREQAGESARVPAPLAAAMAR